MLEHLKEQLIGPKNIILLQTNNINSNIHSQLKKLDVDLVIRDFGLVEFEHSLMMLRVRKAQAFQGRRHGDRDKFARP